MAVTSVDVPVDVQETTSVPPAVFPIAYWYSARPD